MKKVPSVMILMNAQTKESVSKMPSVVILKEVIIATVSTATRETCVKISTSAPVEQSVIQKPNVKTL